MCNLPRSLQYSPHKPQKNYLIVQYIVGFLILFFGTNHCPLFGVSGDHDSSASPTQQCPLYNLVPTEPPVSLHQQLLDMQTTYMKARRQLVWGTVMGGFGVIYVPIGVGMLLAAQNSAHAALLTGKDPLHTLGWISLGTGSGMVVAGSILVAAGIKNLAVAKRIRSLLKQKHITLLFAPQFIMLQYRL